MHVSYFCLKYGLILLYISILSFYQTKRLCIILLTFKYTPGHILLIHDTQCLRFLKAERQNILKPIYSNQDYDFCKTKSLTRVLCLFSYEHVWCVITYPACLKSLLAYCGYLQMQSLANFKKLLSDNCTNFSVKTMNYFQPPNNRCQGNCVSIRNENGITSSSGNKFSLTK